MAITPLPERVERATADLDECATAIESARRAQERGERSQVLEQLIKAQYALDAALVMLEEGY